MIRIHAFYPETLLNKARRQAGKLGIPLSEFLRRALEAYLKS